MEIIGGVMADIDRLKEIREGLERQDDLGKLLERASKHPAGKVADESLGSLREEAYGALKDAGLAEDVKAEDIPEKDAREAAGEISQRELRYAANHLYNHPDEVIGRLEQSELETLAGTKAIISNTEDDDKRDLLRSYAEYHARKDILERYKKDGENFEAKSEGEAKLIEKAAKEGQKEYVERKKKSAKENEEKRQKKLGFEDSTCVEIAESLAERAAVISLNSSKKEITGSVAMGLERLTGEAEKSYEEAKGKLSKPDKPYDVLSAVRDTLRYLATEKDPKKFGLALQAVYKPESVE
jgi:hypothetical protein